MESMIGTVYEIFQIGSFICSILILYFVVKRGISNNNLLRDIPMILWMIHTIIFYSAVFLVRYTVLASPPLFFTSWSTALRFHGYATLLIITYLNYALEKCKWKHP